ncbi:MAG: ABC transporter ATP-binding protein [Firmicutes bacterium]|jgi:branched-chain amino acid transport system ATP-binding protein|nr:ABC transporter ATP-binding protein [Bacillota bacterium]
MLRVENLDVFYGGIHALKGLSLHVDQGEIVTIIGANGAGKSTLLRSISGIVRPKSGSITFEGRRLNTLVPSAIASLGIAHVPEGRRVFAGLSVMENLEMGAFVLNDKKKFKENLDRVFNLFPRLRERAKQRAGTLSGGEQQMLAISRGLMMSPKLLLMDEPSLGLAPVLVTTIFSAIKEINDAGTTILLVEQNAHKALKVANRAYVLETGNLVMEGPASEVAKDPAIQQAYLGRKARKAGAGTGR